MTALDAFRRAFAAAETSAVHVECRTAYAVDTPKLAEWRANPLPDIADRAAWFTPWYGLVEAAVARGVAVRRVRLVDDPPLSDHMQYEYETTPRSLAVGERVRWLPRRSAVYTLLPAVDFWLLDRQRLFLAHFTGRGDLVGLDEVEGQPELATLYDATFTELWARSIAHDQYNPGPARDDHAEATR